ncbi:hypothetical protein D9M69_709420 [compost metagenome]
MRVKASSSGMLIFVSGPMISCTSPPEQKLSPAPVSTTALMSVAFCRPMNQSRSSAYESKVSGFLRSGRLSVTVATPSSLTLSAKCAGAGVAMGPYWPRMGLWSGIGCFILRWAG